MTTTVRYTGAISVQQSGANEIADDNAGLHKTFAAASGIGQPVSSSAADTLRARRLCSDSRLVHGT